MLRDCFRCFISILQSAIKSCQLGLQFCKLTLFQFYKVRLKVAPRCLEIQLTVYFNSTKCD